MKIISLITLISFISLLGYSEECNWSTGITPQDNGYLYTKPCHIRVGETVKDNTKLNDIIQLKDLQIKYTEERVDLWKKQALELEKETKYPLWATFILGIGTAYLSVYLAGKLK